MARIIVSAGHTNKDPGTTVSGVREVDLTRKIAKEVTSLLRADNFITLSVPPDLELAKRIAWINQTGYNEINKDIAIEIHINDGGKKGIEGWHQADKIDSQQLTNDIINEVIKTTGWPSQGNKNEYEHPLGSLAFIHNTNTISCLFECGYIDNQEDFKFLQDEANIKKIAEGIVNGIKKFLRLDNQSLATKAAQNDVQDKSLAIQNKNQLALSQKKQIAPAPSVSAPAVSTPSVPATSSTPAPTPAPVQLPVQTTSFPQSSTSYPGGFTQSGMGGGSTNLGYPGGMLGASGTAGGIGNGTAGFLNRDQRKEMITKNYVKILGREPNQSDLNYFLNTGINEDQLLKKMLDSQEHADLVKARQEVIQTKKRFIEQRNEILRLKAKVNDQRGILKNLNSLLMQKNNYIFNINKKLQSGEKDSRSKKGGRGKARYRKNFQESILDYFSKKLG